MASYTYSSSVSPSAPFDFARSLGFVEMFSPARGEQRVEAYSLIKAIMISGQPVGYSVKSAGSLEQPRLDYTLYADQPISEALKVAALDRLGFYLSLDDDLKPFYALAENDPCMASIVQRLYGLHQVKFPTPFEIAAWAVLTQRMPIPVARKIKDRVVEQYGSSIEIDGQKLWAFPDAAQIAAADPDELLALIKNERKVQYLSAVTQAFLTVDEDFLRSGDFDAVESWLRDIKGIGEWSAKFILVRGLGRMERLSSTEKHLIAAARIVYGPGCDVADTGARYGVQQGYWAYYLRTTTAG